MHNKSKILLATAAQRKRLERALGPELSEIYFATMKRAFSVNATNRITYSEFIDEVTKCFTTQEQLTEHDKYQLIVFGDGLVVNHLNPLEKSNYLSYVVPKHMPINSNNYNNNNCNNNSNSNGGSNLRNDITPVNPKILTAHLEDKKATYEYYLPDENFIHARLQIHLHENELHASDPHVGEYVATLCHVFIKNIVQAMIAKRESYKLRDGFQYGFGCPVADPLVRNSRQLRLKPPKRNSNSGDLMEGGSGRPRQTLDIIEQQTAFANSCGRKSYTTNKLTVRLLYDTLRDNPHIFGLNSSYNLNLLQTSLMFDE